MKQIIKYYNDKSLIKNYLPSMFEITYTNMYKMGLTSEWERDRDLWINVQLSILLDNNIKWILLLDAKEVIGYICFVINDEYILLFEIEIDSKYQGDKERFPVLLGAFIFDDIVMNRDIVCYANTKNIKVINLYKYMGFKDEIINVNKIKFYGNSKMLNEWYINKYNDLYNV